MTKRITIRNIRIFYQQEGKGIPLLLLHGWGKSGGIFSQLIPILARDFTVVALDLPGFGKSDLPPTPWGVSDYSRLVFEFCQKLGWRKFSVIGHSFGGRIAIQLAASYQSSINHLVLTGVPVLRKKGIKRLFYLILAKLANSFFLLPPFFLLRNQFRRIFYFIIGEHDYYQSRGIMKQVFIRTINQNQEKIISKIKAPTLIIWGGEDRITPISQALLLKRKITNSRLRIISFASHKLPYEKTDLFAQEVCSFLKK